MLVLKDYYQKLKQLMPKKSGKRLLDDLPEAIDWAIENLTASGYLADHSVASISDLDRFIDTESQEGGVLLREDSGIIFFAIGAYLGDTLVKSAGASWQIDDEDPQSELNLAVTFVDGSRFLPVRACISRQKRGEAANLLAVIAAILPDDEPETLQDLPNEVE